jgi:hypothetical protein
MTLIFYEKNESVQSQLGTSWLSALFKSGTLNTDEAHLVWVYAEYGGDLTNREVQIQVLLDGVERGQDYHTPVVSGEYKAFCVFGLIETGGIEESHSVEIRVRGGHSSQTVNVRRVRLAVMQE